MLLTLIRHVVGRCANYPRVALGGQHVALCRRDSKSSVEEVAPAIVALDLLCTGDETAANIALSKECGQHWYAIIMRLKI